MGVRPVDPDWHSIASHQLFSGHGAPLRVNRIIHEHRVPLHDHDFIELVVVTGGAAEHHTVAGRSALRRGDVFLLLPGQWHGYAPQQPLEIWNCCFGVGLLARELAWFRSDPLLAGLFPARLPGPGEEAVAARQEVVAVRAEEDQLTALLATLATLADMSLSRDRLPQRSDEIAHLLLVLGRVARIRGGASRTGPKSEIDPAVQVVMDAFTSDLAYGWTLEGLAQRVQLSRSYLVRLFRRHTGLSPMAWLTQRRAEQAGVMLVTTTRPITEIATGVGWADPGYFARRFRAAYGISASEYRTRFPLPAQARKRLD